MTHHKCALALSRLGSRRHLGPAGQPTRKRDTQVHAGGPTHSRSVAEVSKDVAAAVRPTGLSFGA
jgi:hypothetical protein